MESKKRYHGEAVYIINSEGIVYHQPGVLYIIKPQVNTRVPRDEIHGVAVMISTTAL